MRVYRSKRFLQRYLDNVRDKGKIGFVPTMGALHEGHISLVKNAEKNCSTVVVSIFVNPTQFDREEDLNNYPSTLEKDLKMLKNTGCNVVFIPMVKTMYPKKLEVEPIDFDGLDKVMEGAHRKGHFSGVGTIVKRLFELVQPDMAFFGEKDFQQLQIIKKMVEKLKMNIQIVGNPIFRTSDGLAMSSRNMRLSAKQRKAVPFIYKTLKYAKVYFETHSVQETITMVEKEFEKEPLLTLEYFSVADESTLIAITSKEKNKKYRAFIAVFVGNIRLIDNIPL